MPPFVTLPSPHFTSYAVTWIAFNGSAETWAAFQAWLDAEQIWEAPRGPALPVAPHRFTGSFFLCDLPRIRAWWSEHGGDVRACPSLAEPFAAYSDHPVYAKITSLDHLLDPSLAKYALDMSGVAGLLGVDWKARVLRMADALRAAETSDSNSADALSALSEGP